MPTIPVTFTENLLSAWNAAASGAVDDSMHSATSVCNIVLTNDTIRLAICRKGLVVDTAAFALGSRTFEIAEDNVITAISESGETFLNGVAKNIAVGDVLDPSMPGLLSNLIGETVVNLPVRKRPPQISMRLLCTEPFGHHFGTMSYVLCNLAEPGRMTTLIVQSIQDSLSERELASWFRDCPADDELTNKVVNMQLECSEVNELPPINWAPVILLDSDEDWQWLERSRRHLLSAATPYVVLGNKGVSVYANQRKFAMQTDLPKEPFLSNWFMSVDSNNVQLHVVPLRGITHGVT